MAFNYILTRQEDNLIKHSKEILWVEWNEDGSYKSKHHVPAIGRSLIMSPFNDMYTWQTTPIVQVVYETEDSIEFKTKNSHYTLVRKEGKN